MSPQKCWIGLDWGTHSSKWWFTAIGPSGSKLGPVKPEGVIDSTVHQSGGRLRLVRERTVVKSEVQDVRLKRLLLQDPQGASFWDAKREGIGVSLGDAATLSLAVILADASASLEKSGLNLDAADTDIRLCYSVPNWISSDTRHQAARRRMFQTSVVLAHLVASRGFKGLPQVGEEIEAGSWEEQLKEIRQSASCRELLGRVPPDFASLIEHDSSLPSRNGLSWRLAPESSAAGFPQLLKLLTPPEQARRTQDHWVKLLVIDVGAGSTDAGYFVSSRRLDGTLILNYLKPAPTLDYAGEQLTEMLKSFYAHRRQREMTIQEAETIKLSAPEQWTHESFVNTWRCTIAEHVADYMRHVPDHLRLGEAAIPGLKIVMTGGSGLVDGLDRTISEAVVDSLGARGVAGNVANRTEISELMLDWPEDRVSRARRAVSVGAGDSEFARLRYHERFEAAAPPPGPIERW